MRHPIATRMPILMILVALVAGPAAYAHRAPSDPGPRPGPYGSEIAETGVEALDPVENGWIYRSTGTAAVLTNLQSGPYPGSPERVALTWLAENSDLLGSSSPETELLLERVRTSPGGIHVRFRQSRDGTPVWRADVVVSLSRTGETVRALHARFDPALAAAPISAGISIDAGEAHRRAVQAIGISGEPRWIGSSTTERWIVREDDRIGSPGRIAYRVVLPIQEPLGDWEVFIDAADGSILRLSDQRVFTDGSGMVFDPDPLTTAEANYGGNYSDNSDGDTQALNDERFVRTLRDLTFQGGVYHLVGPYVELSDFENPSGAPVTSPDPDGFHFTRSQQGFEDVMCYFHIDQNQRYMQSLGFFDIQNGPIECDAHGLNGQDNSHYIPSQNRVAFGEGGVDDDEDADVIIHEYGHAIQHDIVSNWGGGQQGAMGEGFGDYWAGSYSADVSLFRWDWVFNWDGHNNFWSGRILDTTKHYPENIVGQVHSDGEIWSAPWMQIWFECGRAVTDTDILLHHYYQGGSATMAQAAALAMQADLDLYGGLHAGSLDHYFTARGFFSSNQFDVPELTHTPLEDQDGSGPYPVVVTIDSGSAVVAGSVRVRYGIGGFDQEAVLAPTGNPDEWGGEIAGQGGDVEIRYYLIAGNQAGWTGASPRGAEFQYHSFHVGALNAVDEAAGSDRFALFPASPNPFHPETLLQFALPSEGTVRLRIYDPTGRMVRVVLDRALPAGRHVATWDGRDGTGREMPTGIYLARLDAQGRTLSQKIVMAR